MIACICNIKISRCVNRYISRITKYCTNGGATISAKPVSAITRHCANNSAWSQFANATVIMISNI